MTDYGILSLLPPALAIGLALLTKRVILSLVCGLLAGYSVLAGGNPLTGARDMVEAVVAVFQSAGNARIILFTLLMGALIALFSASGGVAGFSNRLIAWLSRSGSDANRRGQRRRAEILAVLTGMVLFIESNISILTVGTLYRPVMDKLAAPREKLAFIADSTCAPSCILIPFNAWGAYIAGLVLAQGLANPFSNVLGAILFNVYPVLILLLMLGVIVSGKDFGPMARAEERAPQEPQNILTEAARAGRARYMLIPLAVMVICVPLGLIATGWADGGGNLFKAMQSGSGSSAVLYAILAALAVATFMYRVGGVLSFDKMSRVSVTGMGQMLPIAGLMLLAFALGTLCKTLGTGPYLAELASGTIRPAFIPAIIFILACFISFSTGTSWGTFAIMIAIAVPLAQNLDVNVNLAIAAALGGGIFGDHSSPLSDSSLISSMATGTEHMDHVRTQLPYALVAGGMSVVIYLALGVMGV